VENIAGASVSTLMICACRWGWLAPAPRPTLMSVSVRVSDDVVARIGRRTARIAEKNARLSSSESSSTDSTWRRDIMRIEWLRGPYAGHALVSAKAPSLT